MPVGLDPRVLCGVAIVHLFHKHDFAGLRRLTAKASPHRNSGARRVQRFWQATLHGEVQLAAEASSRKMAPLASRPSQPTENSKSSDRCSCSSKEIGSSDNRSSALMAA